MPKIDTADLLDSHEVAEIIGLRNVRGLSVYRARHDDFPAPIVVKRGLMLWHRPDVERWGERRGSVQA